MIVLSTNHLVSSNNNNNSSSRRSSESSRSESSERSSSPSATDGQVLYASQRSGNSSSSDGSTSSANSSRASSPKPQTEKNVVEKKKESHQQQQQQPISQPLRYIDKHTVPVYEDFLMSEGEERAVLSNTPASAYRKNSEESSSALSTLVQQQQLLLLQQLTDRLTRLERNGSEGKTAAAVESKLPTSKVPARVELKPSRPAKNPRLSVASSLFVEPSLVGDEQEESEGEPESAALLPSTSAVDRQSKLDSSLGLAEQLKVNLVSKKSRNQLSRKVTAAQKSLTNLRQFLESL